MAQRNMDRTRTEKERTVKSGLLSANDIQLSRWHLLRKKLKENMEFDGKRPEGSRRESPSFPQKIENNRMPGAETLARGVEDRHYKAPRKGSFYLELKPFKKVSTARPSEEVRPEMKRFKKQPERVRREEPAAPICLEGGVPDGQKLPGFPNTWEHTNFSIVPSVYLSDRKDFPGAERKRKKSARARNRNKSSQRLKSERTEEKEKDKVQILFQDKKKDTQIQVLYPPFDPFPKGRRDPDPGQAVVIYQRHNRRDYLYPRTGDGYQFEQIAFTGNCEAAVDIVQSKRSLSEPRQNIPKEFCVAKRRTRVDAHRMTSTQSDFHSALDFIKQNTACVEFNKFEDKKSSFTRFVYQNPLGETRMQRDLVCEFDGEEGSVKTNMTKIRLKQTAEKKLDLHREMMRAEKTSKKKFWESIERSLNYRCALAQMLSSQSFISQNNSSKFFSTTESSTGRSTNFYVRESVIEKISSYQGFQRFITSNHADPRNKTENITQTSNETYHKMKTFLDSFLIKEEEETLLDAPLEVGFNFRSTSGSTIRTDMASFDFPENFLPCPSASDKFSLLESNLNKEETNSDLEMLMAKLSEEIRRCSRFLGNLKGPEKNDLSAKVSVSDSKIELGKSTDGMTENVLPILSGLMREHAVFPVSVHRSKDAANARTDTWPEKSKTQINFQVAEEKNHRQGSNLSNRRSENLQRQGSNTSLLSFGLESHSPSKDTQFSRTSRKPQGDLLCCDDCKRLKEKIKKLEKELAKVEKRMPFYPVEYQNSIRGCLESLKTTSETVLKRLRSCAKLRYLESQKKKHFDGGGTDSRRPLSAPDTALHKLIHKQLCLRSSNSEYNLNVGMEITMENMDPITGEKLHPEASGCCQQEGNIQCRIFRDKETDKPLLVMDTDFAYNPQTGMLFKEKDLDFGSGQSKDVIIPLEESGRCPRGFTEAKRSVSAYECIRSEKNAFREEPSLQETFFSSREAESSKDMMSISSEESDSLESGSLDEMTSEEVARSIKMSGEVSRSTKMSEKGSRRSSRTNPSVKKLSESDEEWEKCEAESEKTEKDETESEKESKNIIELMFCKSGLMKLRKGDGEGKKREKDNGEPKKKEKSKAQVKKREKSKEEVKKRDKSEEDVKKKEKSREELKKKKKSKAELKEKEKSERELKKREKSKTELKKRERDETEPKKEDKCEAKLKKKEKSEAKLKKKEKSEAEPIKSDKTSLQSEDTQGSTNSCADKKGDRKTVSRIPTRRKTTPSSTRLADDSSSRKSSASTLTDASESSESESHPKISVKLAKLFSFTWTFGFFLCKLVHYMQNVSAICSVLTLTAMSLERYYAIVHPMKAQYICTISQARKIITGTWVSAFLLAVPILFAQVHLRVGVKVEAYWCVRDWDNKTIWRAHELYMMLIILVIPTGVMAVAYTAICWEICQVMQRRHHMTSGKGHPICRDSRLHKTSSKDSFPSALYNNPADTKRTRPLHRTDPPDDAASVQQVVKMLVAVVVIYVICWGPMLIDNVLQAYGIVSHIRMGWPKYMGTAFHLMAYFNSCINPIIYGFMSKNFRESFRKTLCCVRKKPKSAYRSFSLSQTRMTSVRYAESRYWLRHCDPLRHSESHKSALV